MPLTASPQKVGHLGVNLTKHTQKYMLEIVKCWRGQTQVNRHPVFTGWRRHRKRAHSSQENDLVSIRTLFGKGNSKQVRGSCRPAAKASVSETQGTLQAPRHRPIPTGRRAET